MAARRAELIFIPTPGMGHIVSTVEVAKLLLRLDDLLSITVIIIKTPFDNKVAAFTESLFTSATRVNFVTIPWQEPGDTQKVSPAKSFVSGFAEKKPHVKEAVHNIVTQFGTGPDSPRLSGFVIDMFCTSMIDVADEFGVPSYLFFTSGAAFLAFQLHAQELHDEHNVDLTGLKDSDNLLDMPLFRHPFPANLFPPLMLNPEWLPQILEITRRFRGMKGIMVNSFLELESHAINTLLSNKKIPPVYPVGPVLDVQGNGQDPREGNSDLMQWLDNQPPTSVVFLCFGSRGSFSEKQVKEIACALEQSGHRFLWSLRRPPPKGEIAPPTDYQNVEEVLPEGFLNRTAGIGKVIGWAPQVEVLAHPAVGGFVSHCGWNSTLESIWFGVPLAAWPMFAEQQFNAFEIVVELGLGVEIRMDYVRDWRTGDSSTIVSAAEIEKGIKCLMEQDSEVRKRMKEMSEKSRKALTEGGSSHSNLGRFIQDVMTNVA